MQQQQPDQTKLLNKISFGNLWHLYETEQDLKTVIQIKWRNKLKVFFLGFLFEVCFILDVKIFLNFLFFLIQKYICLILNLVYAVIVFIIYANWHLFW